MRDWSPPERLVLTWVTGLSVRDWSCLGDWSCVGDWSRLSDWSLLDAFSW
jgi:hypothetical protein